MRKINDAVTKIEVVDEVGGFDVVITYCDGNTAQWNILDDDYKWDLVDIFKELGFNAEHSIGDSCLNHPFK